MEHATAVTPASLLWLIPALPLAGFAVNALVGWKLQKVLGKRAVHAIAIGTVAASFCLALWFLVRMLGLDPEHRMLQETLWNLFTAGRLSADLAFALDPLSITLVLVITGIGSLIHLFSVGYMADDPAYWRFFAYLNLFVFAMLLLVMGDNFAVMFFGWEGVGLASYLLIAFWYTDPEKAKAGMKAFVVNRIGDFGFLLGLFLLFWALGGAWASRPGAPGGLEYRPMPELRTLDGAIGAADSDALAPRVDGVKLGPTLSFRELRDQLVVEKTGVKERLLETTLWGMPVLALIGILLFVGAMGKSAQLPLYVWLPDAMAGPTPVSALIHAATMVTAGVYMVARLNFLFALSPSAMGWVALVGALTALFAAIDRLLPVRHQEGAGLLHRLASSASCSSAWAWAPTGPASTTSSPTPSSRPASSSAAGSVILGCHHEQDMRKMGGLVEAHAAHPLDLPHRLHRHRRLPHRQRLLLEGRDPLEGLHQPRPGALRRAGALARAGHLRAGHPHRHRHRLLHVPVATS